MSQDDKGEKQERRDFFISYTGQDKPWAEWIAAQLHAVGYTFFSLCLHFLVKPPQAANRSNKVSG